MVGAAARQSGVAF